MNSYDMNIYKRMSDISYNYQRRENIFMFGFLFFILFLGLFGLPFNNFLGASLIFYHLLTYIYAIFIKPDNIARFYNNFKLIMKYEL